MGGFVVDVLLLGPLECGVAGFVLSGCDRVLWRCFCRLGLAGFGGLGLKNWDFPVALWFAGVHAGVLSDARRFWCVVTSAGPVKQSKQS